MPESIPNFSPLEEPRAETPVDYVAPARPAEEIGRMEKRYRFFTDKKSRDRAPLSEERLAELRAKIATHEEIPIKEGIVETEDEEFVAEVTAAEDRIIRFAHGIGVKLTKDNFPPLDMIHQLEGEAFPDPLSYQYFGKNDMLVRKGHNELNEYLLTLSDMSPEKIARLAEPLNHSILQLGLIRSAVTRKAYLGEHSNQRKDADFDDIKYIDYEEKRSGDHTPERFFSWDQGLTNLTNIQILHENGLPETLELIDERMILLTELAKNMADKLNQDPSAIAGSTLLFEKGGEITPKNILGYFQAGMFRNDRRCLRLIQDLYGKEALVALIRMDHDADEIAKVAENLGLGEATRKIEAYSRGERVPINLEEEDILCVLNEKSDEREAEDERLQQFTPEELADAKKRFRFHEPRPEKGRLSESEAERKRNLLATEEAVQRPHGKALEKSEYFLKNIAAAEKRIIEFARELKLDMDEASFPAIDHIYVYGNKDFPYSGASGGFLKNEILYMEETPEHIVERWQQKGYDSDQLAKLKEQELEERIQHELLHSACLQIGYLGEDKRNRPKSHAENMAGLFSAAVQANEKIPAFGIFEEALTELTNHEIFNASGKNIKPISYADQVIFLAELINDMAAKINDRPDANFRYLLRGKKKDAICAADVLQYLQIGMIKSDKRYYRVLKDVYGKEGTKALARLRMENVSEVAKALGLPAAADKIRNNFRGERVEISIEGTPFSHTFNEPPASILEAQ